MFGRLCLACPAERAQRPCEWSTSGGGGSSQPRSSEGCRENLIIAPGDKLVVKHWQEGGEGQESNHQWDQPVDLPLGWSADNRFLVLAIGGHFSLAGRAVAAHGCVQDSNVSCDRGSFDKSGERRGRSEERRGLAPAAAPIVKPDARLGDYATDHRLISLVTAWE